MTTEEQRKAIQKKLQLAVQLEFSTIPPYLMAALSIKPGTNRESFSIIHSVYMEEMLHLALAANVMNAISGNVVLNESTIPTYPLHLEFEGQSFKDRDFDVNTMRFSRENVYTFMQIELPDYWPREKEKRAVAKVEIPGYTIGEFYLGILSDLEDLCKAPGMDEKKVFNGNPSHQVTEDYYWGAGGKPVVVDSMASAKEAIDIIIEQGEGANSNSLLDGDKAYFGQRAEVAHFFRFNEIYVGKYYKEDDDPLEPPTGDDFDVDFASVYPIKKNCERKHLKGTPELMELNKSFNTHYTLMLKGIEKALNGKPKSLYPAIMNDMHQMAAIALKMVQIPINGSEEHGAPTFNWEEIPA